MNELPIDLEILYKREAIPKMIAEISYLNQEKAIEFIRIWGEKKRPITDLFDELTKTLSEISK